MTKKWGKKKKKKPPRLRATSHVCPVALASARVTSRELAFLSPPTLKHSEQISLDLKEKSIHGRTQEAKPSKQHI